MTRPHEFRTVRQFAGLSRMQGIDSDKITKKKEKGLERGEMQPMRKLVSKHGSGSRRVDWNIVGLFFAILIGFILCVFSVCFR